ncbi:MAG: T9SS type A sorting domain-containing protein [Candidatus Eisenbacteria bacterium]|nr:T9SS type A sorting domain-containing protein [Candidatus Eisenbacteria bacterium]
MRATFWIALLLAAGPLGAADAADAWQAVAYPYTGRIFDMTIEGGTLWMSTQGDGLVGYDGMTWMAHRASAGGIRLDNWNYTVFVDAAGDKWVARDGSETVDRLNDGGTLADTSDDVWTYYSHPTELVNFRVFSMAEDAHGTKWFGMRDEDHYLPGIVECLVDNDPSTTADDEWYHFDNAWSPDSTRFSDDDVRALAVDQAGRLWIGYYATGVDVWGYGNLDTFADDTWAHYAVGTGLPSALVHTLHVGPDGRVWAGTLGGLAVYSPSTGSWTTVSGLPGTQVRAIAADAQGHIWVGTDAGVAMLYGSGAVGLTFGTGDGLPYGTVQALAVEQSTGRVWALTSDPSTQATAIAYYDSGFGPQAGLVYVYPNPWKAAEATGPMNVFGVPDGSSVDVYDITGQRVRELDRSEPYAWDTLDRRGYEVPSGVYVVRVETPSGDRFFVKAAIVR